MALDGISPGDSRYNVKPKTPAQKTKAEKKEARKAKRAEKKASGRVEQAFTADEAAKVKKIMRVVSASAGSLFMK